jgi:hypothetical protein
MSGKLPAGDGNGLVAIESQLVRDDNQVYVAIALIDSKTVTIDKDSGDRVAKVRVRRIEVVSRPEDVAVCRRLMERALSVRTGQETLPYDLETEIFEAFGGREESDFREEPGTSTSE